MYYSRPMYSLLIYFYGSVLEDYNYHKIKLATGSCPEPGQSLHSLRTFSWTLPFWRFRQSVKSDYWLRYVCLSVLPHGTTRLLLDGFYWNLVLSVFWKSVGKIQVSLKSDNNNGYFVCRPMYIYNISLNPP